MNKRGQELSTNAIILIVLGIIILAVLIIGFTVGWGKIVPWLSKNNVDTIVTQCGVACSTASTYDYCSTPRELKAEDETLKEVTCYYLSEKQTKYGIAKCPSIPCSSNVILSDATSEENVIAAGVCASSTDAGKIVQYMQDKTLKFYTCPEGT